MDQSNCHHYAVNAVAIPLTQTCRRSLKPITYEDQNPTGLAVRTRHVTFEMKAPWCPARLIPTKCSWSDASTHREYKLEVDGIPQNSVSAWPDERYEKPFDLFCLLIVKNGEHDWKKEDGLLITRCYRPRCNYRRVGYFAYRFREKQDLKACNIAEWTCKTNDPFLNQLWFGILNASNPFWEWGGCQQRETASIQNR